MSSLAATGPFEAYDHINTVTTTKLSSNQYAKLVSLHADPSTTTLATAATGGASQPLGSFIGKDPLLNNLAVVQIATASGLAAWRVPSLGCEVIQHFVSWDKSATNTSKLVADRITYREPDPQLFALASTYSEVKPSDASTQHLKYLGAPDDVIARNVASLAMQDDIWATHRP